MCYNYIMAIFQMLSWWYLSGWSTFIHKIRTSFASIADFFSMSSLVRTLFKPYRQISAETANPSSSVSLKFHMFIDRLISRIIGFISRLLLLIVGTITIIIGGIVSLVILILWPFIPLTPIIGLVLTLLGVTL